MNIFIRLILLGVCAVGLVSSRACDGFQCNDGRMCIPNNWVCDGWSDCSLGQPGYSEDEDGCPPKVTSCNGFLCEPGMCIASHYRCDGKGDCWNDEDEENCGGSRTTIVDGNWTAWSEWSNCTVPCGGGSTTRIRTCSNPDPAHGGSDCQGNTTETIHGCNSEDCGSPTTTVASTTVFVAPPMKTVTIDEQKSTGSSSYIRWGRSECPNTANDLVYSGYGSGTNWDSSGGGTNFMCLHETPEYDRPVPGVGGNRAYIEGVEFRASDFPPLVDQNRFDMNCAVCRVAKRGTMVMIPARMTCPSGWTREYYGYLMGNRYNYKRSEFICVDINPDAVPGTGEDESGGVIYPVEVRCLETDPSVFRGGLPCDKFPEGNELFCVVCTK